MRGKKDLSKRKCRKEQVELPTHQQQSADIVLARVASAFEAVDRKHV